jgi:hypothetical protein
MLQEINYEYNVNISLKYILENTFIPPFQRIESDIHLESIYNGIINYYNTYNKIFIPNIIILGKIETISLNKYIIIDGQHRIKCLEKIYNEFGNKLDDFKLRCDIYKFKDLESARLLYNIINNNKKVELYYGDINSYIIPEIQRFIKNKWGIYCKETNNPKNLNINLDKLCKKIELSSIIEKIYENNKDKTIDQLKDLIINRILKLNDFYSKQSDSKLKEWGLEIFKYKNILHENNFYLGLYRNYEWIDKLDYNQDIEPFENLNHSSNKIKRNYIPQVIRDKIWEKYNNNLTKGKCYCCEKDIKNNDHECGHIISLKNGGSNDIDNFAPICRMCNLDMGIMNLEEYKKYINFYNKIL